MITWKWQVGMLITAWSALLNKTPASGPAQLVFCRTHGIIDIQLFM